MNAMKVETYENTDVVNETEQQSAEVLELCQQLGLEGQLKETNETSTTTRIPYRLILDDENFVFRTLCPDVSPVETYKASPIPIEVLKALAYAKSLDFFDGFEVWDRSSKLVRDPVLVGYALGDLYTTRRYIIARWGEELLPIQALLPDALKIWYDRRKAKLEEIAREVKSYLDQPMPIVIPSNLNLVFSA